MLKYMMLLAVLCCAGCQTPQPAAQDKPYQATRRSEKISVRIEKYVTSYDVEVQRAILNEQSQQWEVITAPRVSGYPEKWRHTESAVQPDGYAAKATYRLAGESISISLEPGAHLIAKVLPEKQNTARVVGVFSQTKVTGDGLEVFSVPFDHSCTVGELVVVYLEEIDVDAVMSGASL